MPGGLETELLALPLQLAGDPPRLSMRKPDGFLDRSAAGNRHPGDAIRAQAQNIAPSSLVLNHDQGNLLVAQCQLEQGAIVQFGRRGGLGGR